MDPEAFAHPIGPLPGSTYWRRRLLVLTLPVLSVLLLAWTCAGGPESSAQSLQTAEQAPASDPETLPATPDGGAGTPTAPMAQPGGSPSAAPSPSPLQAGKPTPKPTATATAGKPTATAKAKAAAAKATTTPSPRITACRPSSLAVDATSEDRTYRAGDPARLVLTVRNTSRSACTADLGAGAVDVRVISGEDRIWSSRHCGPGSGRDEVRLDAGEQWAFAVRWEGSRSAKGCPKEQPKARPGTYRVVASVGELTQTGEAFLVR